LDRIKIYDDIGIGDIRANPHPLLLEPLLERLKVENKRKAEKKENNSSVRMQLRDALVCVSRHLAGKDFERARDAVIEGMFGEHSEAWHAARLTVHFPSNETADWLVEALNESPIARGEVISSLGMVASQLKSGKQLEIIDSLKPFATNNEHIAHWRRTMRAIGALGHPKGLRFLISNFRNLNPDVREAVYDGIGEHFGSLTEQEMLDSIRVLAESNAHTNHKLDVISTIMHSSVVEPGHKSRSAIQSPQVRKQLLRLVEPIARSRRNGVRNGDLSPYDIERAKNAVELLKRH